MASLFKMRITRYVDADGRRVPKGTPGAQLKKEKSRKWYAEYKDMDGALKRIPLCADKTAAQTKLNDIVKNVERRQAGLLDPFEEHEKRPLADHLAEYEAFLSSKGNSEKHVRQVIFRIKRVADGCKFQLLSQLDAPKIATWLSERRKHTAKFSAQTSNFHLDAFKYFCNWLVTHERLPRNPVASLKRVSIETDRRHDRRALSAEEFERLVQAAEGGMVVEGIAGKDRAMLYILATWTGYRRRELASLTLRSFDLDESPPSVKVSASYSKRKRNDVIPLHEYVVERLQNWLASGPERGLDETLFKLKTAKGWFRHTAKMMKHDLAEARKVWIEEAQTSKEKAAREGEDFLRYVDENGLYADFHSNRHSFISRLAQAGVSLVIAQKLARHSDPRLTANRYTHLEMHDKANAIASLSAPVAKSAEKSPDVAGEKTGGSPPDEEGGSALVAVGVAGNSVVGCTPVAPDVIMAESETDQDLDAIFHNPLNDKTFGNCCRQTSVDVKVHPSGFEPETFGSVGLPTFRLIKRRLSTEVVGATECCKREWKRRSIATISRFYRLL